MDLVAWAIEACAEANIWIDLSARTTRADACRAHGASRPSVEAQGAEWRYLRVRITGPNARGVRLPICAIEFYGQLPRVEATNERIGGGG